MKWAEWATGERPPSAGTATAERSVPLRTSCAGPPTVGPRERYGYCLPIVQLGLTRISDLAVESMLALDGAVGGVSGAELARRIGSTPEYLPRVIKPLRAAGWVESSTGPSGGYRLAVHLDEVSLRALIEACEGPIDVAACDHLESEHRDGEPCVLHDPWHRATSVFLRELEETSLADIVR